MREQLASFGNWFKTSLSGVGDLIILNFLFILCCIPVFTAGAAEVACYSSLFRILRGEKVGFTLSGFFKDFAAGFKKATIGWLLELLCFAILAGDAWYAVIYSEPVNAFFLAFAIIMGAVILLAAVWLYPLIARFENKLGAHIKNSFVMALGSFPKTLIALLIRAAFIALPFVFFETFMYLGWFWLLFGASLPLYITARLFRGTLQCYPRKTNINEVIKDMNNKE